MILARYRIGDQMVPALYTPEGEAIDCRELKADWGAHFFASRGMDRLEGWYRQRSKHKRLNPDKVVFGPAVMRPPNLYRLLAAEEGAGEASLLQCVSTASWRAPGEPVEAIREARTNQLRVSIELGFVVGQGGFRIRRPEAGRGALLLISQIELWREEADSSSTYPYYTGAGPYLATADEFPEGEDLLAAIAFNGERVFFATSQQLVSAPADALRAVSRQVRLLPGDVISIGFKDAPPVVLEEVREGDELEFGMSYLGSQKVRVA